jgi:hypothetical protein
VVCLTLLFTFASNFHFNVIPDHVTIHSNETKEDTMGNPDDDETVLFLFIAFAILVVLLFILVLISCQTWMLWKMARAVVEQDIPLTRGVRIERGYPEKGKRRSVRNSVYREDEQLMSGGAGEEVHDKRRTKVWGQGRWI